MSLDLYTPPDVEESHDEWGANCGPCAFAALIHRPVARVRGFFPVFAERPWCNPTRMKAALNLAGVTFRTVERLPQPGRGLVFLQLCGPWDAPNVPVAAAYRHTHWIAVAKPGVAEDAEVMVYDVNGGWLPWVSWQLRVMGRIVDANRGATGWRVRTTIEVLS